MRRFFWRMALLLAMPASLALGGAPKFEAQEIDPHVGNVCYAVTTADVNGDQAPDVVALTEDAIVWFANPKWDKHVILKGATEHDNVCIQAHDIDGDGRVDFTVGAAWRPTDTQGGGTLQWVRQNADGTWTLHPIGSEPTLHRIRWGKVLGDGKKQLIVAPLQGRGTKPPDWGEGNGVRILVYSVPEDPAKDEWPVEVAADSLHTVHNIWPVDFDGDGQDEVLCAAWEGVFLLDRDKEGHWTTTQLGSGNQEGMPKGSSEIKLGRLDGERTYIATIEPWHGFQVVAYTPREDAEGLWLRRVIDEPDKGGHAVWVADLDGDDEQELIVGQREENESPNDGVRGPGVWVFDPVADSSPIEFTKLVLDDGGMACEDLVAEDLDGDGLAEIIAGGRSTHNVKIYWNRTER